MLRGAPAAGCVWRAGASTSPPPPNRREAAERGLAPQPAHRRGTRRIAAQRKAAVGAVSTSAAPRRAASRARAPEGARAQPRRVGLCARDAVAPATAAAARCAAAAAALPARRSAPGEGASLLRRAHRRRVPALAAALGAREESAARSRQRARTAVCARARPRGLRGTAGERSRKALGCAPAHRAARGREQGPRPRFERRGKSSRRLRPSVGSAAVAQPPLAQPPRQRASRRRRSRRDPAGGHQAARGGGRGWEERHAWGGERRENIEGHFKGKGEAVGASPAAYVRGAQRRPAEPSGRTRRRPRRRPLARRAELCRAAPRRSPHGSCAASSEADFMDML